MNGDLDTTVEARSTLDIDPSTLFEDLDVGMVGASGSEQSVPVGGSLFTEVETSGMVSGCLVGAWSDALNGVIGIARIPAEHNVEVSQFSDAEDETGDVVALQCCVGESGLFQAEIGFFMDSCDEVCVDIPCVNESAQASVETVADEHDLIVTDAPAVVEAVAFLFAEEPVPKAPDKYAFLLVRCDVD